MERQEGRLRTAADGHDTLLEVQRVSVYFPTSRKFLRATEWVRAVDEVTLSVRRGETLAVVGESGCGKTTLGRAMVMLQPPMQGRISFAGSELTRLSSTALRKARRPIQMIFQDPYSSLDPRQRVAEIVAEPLLIRGVPQRRRRERVTELLDLVGLGEDAALRLPREFSGGQRQRIGIARALAADPLLIVCDEPLSALDVSIQAQIVNLLIRLQRQLGLTYVFISHDLAVVRQIADRVAVMYLGSVVELGKTRALFEVPRHPYTVALRAAVPTLASPKSVKKETPVLIAGDPPSPVHIPTGCRFHPRCWFHDRLGKPKICVESTPGLQGGTDHLAACHFASELAQFPHAGSGIT